MTLVRKINTLPPQTLTDSVEIRLGARLRDARLRRGKSLRETADIVGCSESFLSKIENNKVQPSIVNLHRIAMALGTSVAALFAEPEASGGPVRITRSAKRPSISGKPTAWRGDGVTLERLIAPRAGAMLQANIVHVEPNGRSDGFFAHEGEEFGFILAGELELIVDGNAHTLRAGDTFCFPSHLAHGYRNAGRRPARILWVNTPQTF